MNKKSFIDKVRVKDPCTQAWDEMVGNDKVRFCTHCAKDVNNISAMTRKDAVRLVRKSGGSLCIRYVQQPVTKAPMFAEQLTQITRRRVPLMAAGVMSASLSLATMTYAQGGAAPPPRNEPIAAKVSECEDAPKADGRLEKTGSDKSTNIGQKNEAVDRAKSATLRGAVLDPNGAVVPNTRITLVDDAGTSLYRLNTDENGAFRFDKLRQGSYSLQTEAANGFTATRMENIAVGEGETIVDLPITISVTDQLMGVVASGPEFEGALAIAVSNEDLEEVQRLISAGENVNRKEEDGTTPLFIAVENGDLNIVQMLLDAGAKINARNKQKETPFMQIDGDAPVELVELLVRYGAKVNQISKSGNTALILSAARGAKPDVIKALIDAGADLDVQNEDGMTALMAAADSENIEAARALVLAGANVNLKDKEGDTAWDKTSNEDLETLLESYGAVIDDDTPEPEQQR